MPLSEDAIILAPGGRDAPIAAGLLKEVGIGSDIATSVQAFVTRLEKGAGFAVVTEEALTGPDLHGLSEFLKNQQEWSDLPFVLLTRQGGGLERNPASARYLDILGNVTFLDRPFHPTTFVSLARAAIRARRRQYVARHSLETIRRGEEQLVVAISAAHLGTWTLDLVSLELVASAKCKEHYGRRPDQGFSHAELVASIHPEDWEDVRKRMKAAENGARDYAAEYRTIWPDGSIHWLQVKGSLDVPSVKLSQRMSGVTLDITTDKLAQAALLRSEDRFRAAVEAVKGVLWTNNAEGEMSGDQPGWAELTGQSFDEYQGYGWADAVHPEDADPTIEAWNHAVAEHQPFEFEHRVRRSDGSWGNFSIRAIPAYDSDGSVREWVGVHTDITDQRTAERELSELAATLEQRVIDAMQGLREAEANLMQAQKLETIGQLTGGVAHDFNNLLTPIVASLEVLQRRLKDDDRAQRLAAAGLQSAERARILVSRLLSFSRRQSLEPRVTDIGSLIEGMKDLIKGSVGPTVTVVTLVDQSLPNALVDPNQLELSILNLCVNARDAMQSGGEITISARTERVSSSHPANLQAGNYICLEVRDAGIGMDADTQKRAVEPFYTTKGVGKGTGLGLSMVHGLAAQLGGGMTIESALGEGTSVFMFLPATSEKASFDPSSGPPAGQAPSKAATVLLVDDEQLVRFATSQMLRDVGYNVHEASSATEAVELVRTGLKPDILVTDQLMPGTTGTELALQLRETQPDLHILIATGYSDLPDLGFPRIAKPFGAAALVERVRRLIEGGSERLG